MKYEPAPWCSATFAMSTRSTDPHDEARTPLTSGAVDDKVGPHNAVDALLPQLSPGDYEVDEKLRFRLLHRGRQREDGDHPPRGRLLKGESLYDVENVTVVHHTTSSAPTTCSSATRTTSSEREVNTRVHRPHAGPALLEGLHQALEAKEHVQIRPRTRRSPRSPSRTTSACGPEVAGMTGTAFDRGGVRQYLRPRRGRDSDQRPGRASTTTTRSTGRPPRRTRRSSPYPECRGRASRCSWHH